MRIFRRSVLASSDLTATLRAGSSASSRTARRVPTTYSADTPLLEREEEVAALAAAIARAARGEGALLVVEAQAGLGKSRLLDAAAALAADRGLQILRGTGHPLERELAFGVALQLFEPALPARGPRRDALFEGAAGLARPLLDPDGAAPVAGGEPALLHGLYWLTSNLAEASPLALVVDDVHWADHSSLRFLAYLARRLDGLHVVLAAAQRPREPGAPGRLLAELRGHGAALSPRPLGEEAARRLVCLRFPTAATGFVRAALELTGGNPFLLEELLRGFAERGEEPGEAAGAQLARLAPESVLRSVSARVARLPTGAPALARAAAVMGSGAHLRTAGALAALDRDAARAAADALVDAELLAPGDPLAFAHPLLRSVVYDDIPAAERAAAHGRAARLLAADGATVEEVAAHLLLAERAGEPWTVATLEAAAQRSLADGAPDSAVAYLRRALEEPPHAAHRGVLLHALGQAEAAAGRPEAVDHLSDAVARIGDVRERALAAQDLARALHTESRYMEAAAVLDRALAELGDGHERLARELEAIWVSVARLALPLRQRAVERLAAIAARPRAETYAERLLLAQVSGQKVFAGEPREEACALAGAALAGGALLTEGGPDDQGWLIALGTFGWSDDYETCDRGIETCVEDARRRGLLRRYASALYGRTMTGYFAGRLTEVVADNEQAIALRQGGWQEYLPAACAQLAWALIERDELDAAARTLSLAGLDAVENASQVLVIEARARLAARRGDLAGALELALESGRVAEAAYVTNPSCLQWRSTAAVAAAQLGDAERAEELVADELWRARRFGAPRPIGVALRASGLVAGGDTGTEMMREAVAVLEDSPARLEHARALVDLGAALRRTGHRAEARAPLREGLGLAERCGAVAIERRAREELKASGARARPRPRSGRDTLTPSELRVAGMAISGMTNREIAQALFVTSKAVQFHLGNCYRKLGVAGRDELAVAIGPTPGHG